MAKKGNLVALAGGGGKRADLSREEEGGQPISRLFKAEKGSRGGKTSGVNSSKLKKRSSASFEIHCRRKRKV